MAFGANVLCKSLALLYVAKFLGRAPQQISVVVPVDGVVEANFTLGAAALRLSDVVVTAS